MDYIKFVLLIFFLFFYIWVFIVLKMKRSSLALLERVKEGAIILDIRSAREYNNCHYAKAVNIPFNSLFAKKDRLGSIDNQIIVYGRSFNKCFEAEKILRGMGYKNIFVAGTLRDMPKLQEEGNG
ncbi:rhodanese-like domain-containing protein [Borrelia sp. BU AG58]|uniref:rhodanese-like domain-containing protein n=1 Tax=Borrelia sp. BU AG58 TaxID=2887345 RepID=UPI001E4703D3|nr:rhodanese-like domain-containing protein [Borrelia sp. BU AG58]UER67240.1 rhodanese-like domain-containing protein [Borrelia sp. BU AG58]